MAESLGDEFTSEDIDNIVDKGVDVNEAIEETKSEKLKRVLKEKAIELQAQLPKNLDNRVEEKGTEEVLQQLLDDMTNFDIDHFETAQELKDFNRAMSRIIINGDYQGAKKYSDTQRSLDGYKELAKVSKDFNLISTLFDYKGFMRKNFSSLDVYADAIFGKMSKHAAKFKLWAGFSGVSQGSSEAVTIEGELIDIMKGLRKKHPKAFKSNKAKFIRGLYNKLVAYNIDEDPTEAFARNKE